MRRPAGLLQRRAKSQLTQAALVWHAGRWQHSRIRPRRPRKSSCARFAKPGSPRNPTRSCCRCCCNCSPTLTRIESWPGQDHHRPRRLQAREVTAAHTAGGDRRGQNRRRGRVRPRRGWRDRSPRLGVNESARPPRRSTPNAVAHANSPSPTLRAGGAESNRRPSLTPGSRQVSACGGRTPS
jgi:hypothetical protein